MLSDFSATSIPTTPELLADDEESQARFLRVRLHDTVFALPVEAVREVVRAKRLTRVPGAPPHWLGLANVRGMVVTVLDLALTLGVTGAETRAVPPGSIVLSEHAGRLVGLAVDAVLDVCSPDADVQRADVPVAMTGVAATGALGGVTSALGDAMVVLDVRPVLAREMLSSEVGR